MSNRNLNLTLKFNADNKEFLGQVKASSSAVNQLGDKSRHTGSEFNNLAKNSSYVETRFSSLKAHTLGLVSGLSALAVAINAKNTLGQYQDMRTQITALVGGQEQWLQTEQYLNRVAEEHNKTVADLSGSYARLLTLQNGGLITQQQVTSIFEGMSNAASANGATNEHLSNTMYGLQQAMASGTVRAEEFNQVTESMPDLLIKLAESADTTVGGLRNMVNSGKMTSELFGELLVKALAKYDGAAARNVDNIRAQENAFSRAYQDMVLAFEKPISTVFSNSVSASVSILDTFTNNANLITDLVGGAMVVALGRGSVAVANLTREKAKDIAKTLQGIQVERRAQASELASIQAEIRHLEVMRLTNNQRFMATGAANTLAAAEAREKVVKDALVASQARLNVTMRAGTALMGALGGPAGIAVMAASALGYYALSAKGAEQDTERLKDQVNALLGKMNAVEASQLEKAITEQTKMVTKLRDEYTKIALAPAPGQTLWQRLTENNGEMRERQIQEARETASLVTSVQRELSEAENNLSELQQKLARLRRGEGANTPVKPPTITPPSGQEDAIKAGERMLENLAKQAVLFGETSELKKVNYEIEHGALMGINDDLAKKLRYQAQIIDQKRAEAELVKNEKKTDKIDDFHESSDQINADYLMRLAIQADYENRAKIQEQHAYAQRQEQLQTKFSAAYEQAAGNQQLMNDLEKEYFFGREVLRQEHEMNLTQIMKDAEDERQAYQYQVAMDTLSFTQQQLSITTDFLRDSGKEQSGLYRTLLAAQKLAAIPSMIIATEEAATKALTLGPIAGPIASAAVRVLGYTSVGIVAGQAIAGQAHDGINRVPKANEGTWLLKADEMVLNPTQADNFRWMVGAMRDMKAMFSSMTSSSAGSASSSREKPINVHVHGVDKERVHTSASESGGEINIEVVIDQAVNRSLQAVYNDFDNGGPISMRSKAN
ncbi:hypothetical protein ATY35_11085 [Vibrio cidicii]|uniref:Tape measure protein N-terminal domain-containing protein n=1 Tax=Vibrio cidicii TaxID=1763883 RepID=A0ABR5W5L0_9VIBR|nr:tape measure protein [Vibrio cidicii]KYN89489.1 hypothetical protein ATY35_11085 [Vibrio cidicii]